MKAKIAETDSVVKVWTSPTTRREGLFLGRADGTLEHLGWATDVWRQGRRGLELQMHNGSILQIVRVSALPLVPPDDDAVALPASVMSEIDILARDYLREVDTVVDEEEPDTISRWHAAPPISTPPIDTDEDTLLEVVVEQDDEYLTLLDRC